MKLIEEYFHYERQLILSVHSILAETIDNNFLI